MKRVVKAKTKMWKVMGWLGHIFHVKQQREVKPEWYVEFNSGSFSMASYGIGPLHSHLVWGDMGACCPNGALRSWHWQQQRDGVRDGEGKCACNQERGNKG